jgi:predicted regulator of Ras-like GTPase activity (Roadblock/LC7/MglB family)
LIKAIMRANEMLDAGTTREICFSTDKLVTLIRVLNENYFMTLTLTPGGNRGKGRYLMRTAAPSLVRELG